jgi:pyroglutamyl-peptidase
MTATVLITGFGSFPGAPVNPTAALAERLARTFRRRGVRCVPHVFSTAYHAVDRDLPALIRQHRPVAILMFGLAARRRHLSVELCARNRVSPWFPDAAGFVPQRATIAPGALAHVPGRAPFAKLLTAARATGIKTKPSRDAGGYVCNYVYWRALESAGKPGCPRVMVFVHVPAVQGKFRPSERVRHAAVTFAQLMRAGIAILSAVVAASRH